MNEPVPDVDRTADLTAGDSDTIDGDTVNRAPTIDLDMTGFPTRDELVQRYSAAGHSVDHIQWYEAFASWKHAVVLQQLHQRFVVGDSTDLHLGELGLHIDPIVELAASNIPT